MKQEVHAGGMFAATAIAGLSTIGANLTTFRGVGVFDSVWIGGFVVAWLLISAAAVNFDMKRWLW